MTVKGNTEHRTPPTAHNYGFIVKFAVLFTTRLAVIVATVDTPTPDVVTVNVAVFAPASTVTLAGTTAAALLLERATFKPPGPAFAVSVTVPVELNPPVTVVGVN